MNLIAALIVTQVLASSTAADERVEAPPERAYSAFAADPARRFDFWIGEWDVNLRMLQDDGTMRDSARARASIHRILDGKAILELWDSKSIEGFSLRYYDPVGKAWKLWLGWPSRNVSGLDSLEGNFRHGRGEFRARSTDDEGGLGESVHTFADITPFSLRWEDRHSTDGGKTWSYNRVMEFTREAIDARWPIRREKVPTFTDGGLCDDERFRDYEQLVGTWTGDRANLELFPILEGCAVMGFLDLEEGADEFLFLTYDSADEQWVTAVLDDEEETGLTPYTGNRAWYDLVGERTGSLTWTVYRKGPESLGRPGDGLVYVRDGRELRLVRSP